MKISQEDLKVLLSGMNLSGAQVNIGNDNVSQTVNVYAKREEPQEKTDIDPRLLTPEAQRLTAALVAEGWLGEDLARRLSWTEAALVAAALAQRLQIADVWQTFGRLWQVKPQNLRAYYNKALNLNKSLEFQDRIKKVLNP